MEATFVLKQEQLTPEWLEQLKRLFDEQGTLTITVSGSGKPLSAENQRVVDQQNMVKRMLETQKKYPPKKISPEIDINKLIDEMYWEGNH
ncbi:hypothetical protein ACO2Q8_21590 [Larkinella sp. VNQ87]|uniref:hypothetical protein n=1 Tax=Larkinella sp. VNQ87 TaxID=3400921 RepID=UPI003C08453A